MGTKHTPGPWVVVRAGNSTLIRSDSQRGYFAKIEGACAGAHGAEGEANARLIAAAPDLLEALKKALPLLEEHIRGRSVTEAIEAAEAAIAKAEGSR